MDVKLSKIASELRRSISPVREIMQFASKERLRELKIREEDFISFGGGWVNHRSPDEMQQLYVRLAESPERFHECGAYSPTNGEPDCKKALVEFERELFGLEGLCEGNIVVGQSSTQLTHLLLRILLDPDDAVCVLDPSYCNYPLQIHTSIAARVLRFPVLDAERFSYLGHDPGTVEKFVAFLLERKPKVVMLVSPDNPTSQVLSQEFVVACHEAVKSYGGVIVMDFAYKTLCFGAIPEYFRWAPDGNFMSVHSNSKWCHGLGRRLGWVEVPDYVVEAFESLQNSTTLCPDHLHQMVLTEYIKAAVRDGSLRRYTDEVRQRYARTAEVTIEAIAQHLQMPHLRPQGGLYTCISVRENGAAFVERVLKNTGVLFIPGWGFGHSLNKAVRLSFGPHVYRHQPIIDALKRVAAYLHESSHHPTS
jgi:aspartate/methionine/tyrosine aminotransferase